MAPVAVASVSTSASNTKDTPKPVGLNHATPRFPPAPEITYHPNHDQWLARTTRRLAQDPGLLSTPLPDGFPTRLDSRLVWEGKDWQDEKQWVFELDVEQLKEIDDAVKHFHSGSIA